MRFTPMFKHTKSMKEDIMIEITWLSYDFLFCQHLCTLVRRVPGISFLICTVLHSYLRAEEWNFQSLAGILSSVYKSLLQIYTAHMSGDRPKPGSLAAAIREFSHDSTRETKQN